MQGLIAGRIDYQCAGAELAVPQIQANLVKAIAILTKDRSPVLKNLASAHEQGLADFEAAGWVAFVFAEGHARRDCAKDATVATMNTPGVQERLTELGDYLVAHERRSPEYLRQFIANRHRDREMAESNPCGQHQGRMTRGSIS
jgi:tripartite-type tricarboxylate transporter receptor subunit TctC